jgi:ribonuclease Y
VEVLLGIALVLVLVGILGLAVLLVRQQRQLAAAGARLRPGAPAAAPRPESRPAEPLPAEALEQVRTQALEQARTEVLEQARIEAREQVRHELAREAEEAAAQARMAGERHASAVRERAEADAEQSLATARARAAVERDELLQHATSRERQLAQRESALEQQHARLDDEVAQVAAREHQLARTEAEIARRKAELADLEAERHQVLERVAGLTSVQARAELVRESEQQAKREAAKTVREIEQSAKDEGEERARRIVTLAIQRVASEQTAESVVSVLHLPHDDMKGRIIGREGRNIRAYESITGVNVIIDDTPEAVLLSCFDPVRREVGRLTLEALVLDGRIHPQRIEEQFERATREVDALCVRAGEDAVVDVGIADMHPELIALLGRLRYRTSYGQNVLKHLIESAHLAGVMAYELRLPAELAKRGTLLHDLGKALTHEVEGSHALVGAEVARRYGEHEDVVHAIEAHHNEVEPRTIGAVLTQAADQISGGRPGARRESLESYVQRLERIEQIASDKPGVERVFAMQAGREVRVMVVPDQVDDIGAQVLARDIARQIEDELTYPGQIRVTVVRETRASDIAR